MSVRTWYWIVSGLTLLLLNAAVVHIAALETPTAAPPKTSATPVATPTIDRLAAPPTVPSPTQADEGAQLYWLWCQPCHGDQGQGLTDEWRAQYPEEDQYCWNRACHGNIPYEDGFTLPKHVPALIGGQSLARFQTMDELYEYVHVKMPYEYPGALTEEEALAVTAYLARAHDKWDGTALTAENIGAFRWQPLPTATPQPGLANLRRSESTLPGQYAALATGALLVGLALLGGVYLWRRHR